MLKFASGSVNSHNYYRVDSGFTSSKRHITCDSATPILDPEITSEMWAPGTQMKHVHGSSIMT